MTTTTHAHPTPFSWAALGARLTPEQRSELRSLVAAHRAAATDLAEASAAGHTLTPIAQQIADLRKHPERYPAPTAKDMDRLRTKLDASLAAGGKPGVREQ